ncbi:PspA/IM30 family protein [Acidithiobacillus sp.]|jgi:phage shock protein A|uniref:PspA/IM30 family protein n=1 Tax=Acidithiobacillus sp. TaxID=1872118 RepID=UPI0025BB22E0|nr:PspA/IM30 family protein [Acidithiobacillus sp.]MCK9189619.1 PspA/IM30 family protein [Acidithiobacillus sp.]MCK9359814.1 PspA/IM30 family protein [Acidithiobacillus sp.]
MSIFKHAANILEAKVNKLLSRAEDPAETLDLSYEKMLTSLQEAKRHLADVVTERVSLENQIAQAQKLAARAEDDARMALNANREDLARSALTEKQAEAQKITALQQAHDTVAAQAQKLMDYEHALQERIEQFRTQKEVMKSQMAAAQAQVKVTESLTGLGHGLDGAGDALRRVQDRTAHEQAKAQALDGLLESGIMNDPLDHRTQTEREMDKLRATSGVDDDLTRLKAERAAKQD